MWLASYHPALKLIRRRLAPWRAPEARARPPLQYLPAA